MGSEPPCPDSPEFGARLDRSPHEGQLDPPPARPWETEQAFPKRPAGGKYGFLAGKSFHECSREELILRCSRDEVPPIHLVWTPEAPRLVPPGAVPFLQEAVRKRTLGQFKISVVTNLFMVIFSGGMILLVIQVEGWGAPSATFFLLLLAMGGWAVVGSVRGFRLMRRWTPMWWWW